MNILVLSYPFIYSTHRSNENQFEYDCVDLSILSESSIYDDRYQYDGSSQTIPYCIRPSYKLDDYSSMTEFSKNKFYEKKIMTFEQLHHELHLTANDILNGLGYTSIEVIERYQIYLETLDESMSQEKVYKCKRPWFGTECQYKFLSESAIIPILDIQSYFTKHSTSYTRSSDLSLFKMTCYTHISCNRGPPPACLDWREICDGKIDCANDNGIDERFCDSFDRIVCNENEYRCQNGRQCIPKEFYRDDPMNPDCQDASDEILKEYSVYDPTKIFPNECDQDASIRCEERSCPPNTFACGDGQCVTSYSGCHNKRGELIFIEYGLYKNTLSTPVCQSLLAECSTHIENIDDCENLRCHSKIQTCAPSLGQLCASTIFKHSPSRYRPNDEMYVFYSDHPVPGKKSWYFVPHDNCFNDTHCENTKIFSDKPTFSWCQTKQNSLLSLIYIGTYSRRNLTETIERLTGSCSKRPNHMQMKNVVDHKLDENLLFFELCNGRKDSHVIRINNRNETDETECDYWPCNNVYTRCDGYKNCPDGNDEWNCTIQDCLLDKTPCIPLITTDKLTCISGSQYRNFKIDCMDGWKLIYQYHLADIYLSHETQYCSVVSQHDQANDEMFCHSDLSDLIQKAINHSINSLHRYLNYKSSPKQQINSVPIHEPKDPHDKNIFFCHRGLDAYALDVSNITLYKRVCFCPPAYYGNQCQYQSDRVSLTLHVRSSIHRQAVFIFSLTLRDDQYQILSFVTAEYRILRDCSTKFNYYLLYSKPMKDRQKTYFVHIDLIMQDDLLHYASWYFPIQHHFLPVTRISTILNIPVERTLPIKRTFCTIPCDQGQCIKYVNRDTYFCQCKPGWSGRSCSIEQQCDCSSDSLCVGWANGRSICICPVQKIGPRCLFQTPCTQSLCHNGGLCVPEYIRQYRTRRDSYRCICTDRFEGAHCNISKTLITFGFIDIERYGFMSIHILSSVINFRRDSQEIIFKRLRLKSSTETVFISSYLEFNFVFVQMKEIYYLAVVKDLYMEVENISAIVSPKRQCSHINHLFNQSFIQLHPFRRLKYYPKLCRDYEDLVCFHDDIFMCLCTQDRFSNCFRFDFKKNFTCQHVNPCEKYGHCLEDHPECRLKIECICQECYYGSRCQFSTIGLGVSLDAILGYEILPKKSLFEQTTSIQISTIIILIFFLFGFLSNLMSLITFHYRGQTCMVGCGYYLLVSSVTCLLTMIFFALKFTFLLLTQMSIITNSKFLYFNCLLADVATQICLTTSNWLSACVAIERTICAIQQTKFNAKKSRRIVVWVVFTVIISVLLTHLPDPIYRTVIEDEDEQRRWCIVRYPSSIERFNSINSMVHFVTPFAINALTAIIIIVVKTQSIFKLKKEETYFKHLRKQFHQFRHLLISPIILVLLSIPRLILAFLPGCMKSNEDLWIYLTGYFISFLPPLLTFPIFVLPSDFYKQEFVKQTTFLFNKLRKCCYH